MTNSNNEDSFKKILAANHAKERQAQKRERKVRDMELGDTEAGRTQALGANFAKDRERFGPDHRGTWKLRTYRRAGATKGRGKMGGIR